MYASSVDNRSLLSMKLWIVDLQFMPVALQYFLDCAHFQLCRRTDCNVGKLNNDDMCNTLPSPLASLLSDGKSAIAMRFGSRGPSCSSRIRCRNALTEKAYPPYFLSCLKLGICTNQNLSSWYLLLMVVCL